MKTFLRTWIFLFVSCCALAAPSPHLQKARGCVDPQGGLGCPEGYFCVGWGWYPEEGVCLSVHFSCGDGFCGPGENGRNCPSDCRDISAAEQETWDDV